MMDTRKCSLWAIFEDSFLQVSQLNPSERRFVPLL